MNNIPTPKFNSSCPVLRARERELKLDSPKLMGILNVTPDSFSDGGEYLNPDKALDKAAQLHQDGAVIIDVGGESTRPGASQVSLEEELSRVIPVVERLSRTLEVMISVDTSAPEVMSAAAAAGAHIWNDIRALSRPGAPECAAALDLPVILMHMQGSPQTMQDNPAYHEVLSEVETFLQQRTQAAVQAGVKPEHILWDPGFGFGKSVQDNYTLLGGLARFCTQGYPVVGALSRKSMLGAVTGIAVPASRVISSVAGALICAQQGALILRVHDVRETAEALQVLKAMHKARSGNWDI